MEHGNWAVLVIFSFRRKMIIDLKTCTTNTGPLFHFTSEISVSKASGKYPCRLKVLNSETLRTLHFAGLPAINLVFVRNILGRLGGLEYHVEKVDSNRRRGT